MKREMIFAMTAAVVLLSACSSESEESVFNGSAVEEETEVTLTFSPYEVSAMARQGGETTLHTTRAATSISGIVTRLDVWISEDGTVVEEVHQTKDDGDFGTVSVSLNRLKTYTLVAVGHRGSGSATLTDNVIAFPDDKTTHSMVYTTTFSPGTATSLNCLMTRIVGQIVFEITDQVPDEAYTMQLALGTLNTRWNVSTSVSSNPVERTSTFTNFSRNGDGTATFIVYAMPTNLTDTDHIGLTVTALNAGGDAIETKTFADVPVKAGYRTTYRGQFFTTTGETAGFTVEEWSDFDVIEY